ncbi:hypothetical protein J1605_007644 [Eschrichtius robustus]|nr:hypothetical protein J1605_007644 [Eschrichtius robustus]
MRDKGLF